MVVVGQRRWSTIWGLLHSYRTRTKLIFSRGQFCAGFGYYRDHGFVSFNYNFNKRRYGIPFDPDKVDPEIVNLNPRRHSFEARGGLRTDHLLKLERFPFNTSTTHTPR